MADEGRPSKLRLSPDRGKGGRQRWLRIAEKVVKDRQGRDQLHLSVLRRQLGSIERLLGPA